MRRISSIAAPLLLLLLAGCFHKKLADGVRGDPNDDEAWGDAGDAEAAMGNRSQALIDYQRALGLDPRDAEWQRKVAEFGGVEVFRSSIDLLLPDSPADDEALGDRGDAFETAGLHDEACALFRRAQALDTQDTEWLTKVGTCDAEVATDLAPVEYSGLLGMIEGTERYEGGVVGGVLGGDYVGGLGGGDVSGYGGYGAYGYGYGSVVGDPAAVAAALDHARQSQKPEARNALWVALQADPNAPDLRAMWTLLTGETSVVLLQRLAEANPEDPALWGALGDAKLVAGKRAEAITSWQKAAALAPFDTTWSNRLEMAKSTVVK